MVSTIIKVIDSSNTPIEGIPVKVHITSCNPIGGLSNNYWLYGNTNANGEYVITNAQAYCQFIAYANYNNQFPNYTSGQGTTSTTLTQGGFATITLQSIIQPTLTKNGTLTCPSGYSIQNINNQNVCVKNPNPIPQIQVSYLEIFMIIIIIVIIAVIIKYVRKK